MDSNSFYAPDTKLAMTIASVAAINAIVKACLDPADLPCITG